MLYSEGHVHWATLTWLILVVLTFNPDRFGGILRLGAAIALAFLARLDSMFLVAAILIWGFAMRRPARPLIVAGLIAAVFVVPYLLYNRSVFGGLMPVSGWMKSTFPEPFIKGFNLKGLRTSFGGYSFLFGVLPLAGGLAAMFGAYRKLRGAEHLLTALTAGVLLHFLYIFCFTRSHTLWYWYYVQSVLLGSIAVCVLTNYWPGGKRLANACGLSIIVVAAAAIGLTRWKPPFDHTHWLSKSLRYIEDHGIHDETIITSDYPGYFAFKSDNRIFALDLLTSNRRFYDKMLASENAMHVILEECRAAGKPARYVFYLGYDWLTIAEDRASFDYNDPRMWPTKTPIGRLSEDDGLQLIHQDGAFLIWRLRETGAKPMIPAAAPVSE